MPRPDTIGGSANIDYTTSSNNTPTPTTGTGKVIDRIINSSVIRRQVVEGNATIAAEKYVSPNLQEATNTNIGGSRFNPNGGVPKPLFTPSAEELQAMTAQAPDSGTNTVTDTVNNAVATAKANPIVMYAAIGLGAILIYKYFIK